MVITHMHMQTNPLTDILKEVVFFPHLLQVSKWSDDRSLVGFTKSLRLLVLSKRSLCISIIE